MLHRRTPIMAFYVAIVSIVTSIIENAPRSLLKKVFESIHVLKGYVVFVDKSK